ncbi:MULTISPECIES: hypothetical protein [Streptomyces]|uniref:hypothetical protein n=1 Tax=Streptomyces TaxID=1883 RepID=UPI000B9ED361|nr:hypothetical protein [Streptomyces kasugaensis]
MTVNPLARFVPFPEPPALITEYIAERSAEESVVDGPSPWDIGALSAELIAPLPEWLDAVCRWLNQTYAWQPQHVIPPCWTEHDHLTYEIAAFAFARADAYQEAGSVVLWHEQYDRFLIRMNNALGKAGEECRIGRHDARPARFQLDAWPAKGSADAGVPEVATPSRS